MKFAPSPVPPSTIERPLHIVIRRDVMTTGLVRGREILVASDGRCLFDEPEIAQTADVGAAIHLGALDGRPCFTTFASDAPEGTSFTPLRAALGALGDDHFAVV